MTASVALDVHDLAQRVPDLDQVGGVIEDWGKRRERGFTELLEDDGICREVLSTASSLGASAEASRLGRRALVTALGSLLVAVVALLVANTGGETLWSELVKWIGR